MWNMFLRKIERLNLGPYLIIYTHNLGSFDGMFILPAILSYSSNIENVKTTIDDENKVIFINYKFHGRRFEDINWTFKDYLRILPVTLEKLCETFKSILKLGKYNLEWNNHLMFRKPEVLDPFLQYAENDSRALLDSMNKARNLYWKEYPVDISRCVSTSSLLIYRSIFMTKPIPILFNMFDQIIRKSYIGGSTDYYHFKGRKLKYFDVNSLYPKAMKNLMPLEPLSILSGSDFKSWYVIFGFVDCIVKTPKGIKYPLLPYKYNGHTIHPEGVFRGIYFSEELKAVMKHGYEIEIIKVYQFSKARLFDEYVDHFYKKKK